LNLDYSDSFTGTDAGGAADRPYLAAVQTAPTYVIESAYGGVPVVNFQTDGRPAGVGEFSIASDQAGTPGLVNGVPPYPGSSGAGSDLGFTQTGTAGGVDWGIPYGIRDRYLVQFDAVNLTDRIDITTGSIPGTIGAANANSLSIFFRGDGSGNASLYNGAVDTPIQSQIPGFNTGLANDGQWHNFAALFDQTAKTLELFVDEQTKGLIDLTTFAGGLYANFSNAAVGVGGSVGGRQDRIWTDNFQVGEPNVAVPEPATVGMLVVGLTCLVWARRRTR
jgi:hypothetical protein